MISPSEQSFNAELSLAVGSSQPELKSLVNSARPFVVLVKNTNNVDLVGCRIEWEIIKADGTNTKEEQSYLNPGVLEGLEALDNRLVGHTSLVNAHSSGMILLDVHAHHFIDARIKGVAAGTLPPISAKDKRNIEQLSRQMRKDYDDSSSQQSRARFPLRVPFLLMAPFWAPIQMS